MSWPLTEHAYQITDHQLFNALRKTAAIIVSKSYNYLARNQYRNFNIPQNYCLLLNSGEESRGIIFRYLKFVSYAIYMQKLEYYFLIWELI